LDAFKNLLPGLPGFQDMLRESRKWEFGNHGNIKNIKRVLDYEYFILQ